MKTFGYVRVSTDRQAEQGISLEAQKAKIRAMATVQGVELNDIIVDGGESAKSLNRPGMARLLEMIDSGQVYLFASKSAPLIHARSYASSSQFWASVSDVNVP